MVSQPDKNEKQIDREMTLKEFTPNLAGLLCYVGGWISGIILLILEQKNRFVRFHALQSIVLFGSFTVAYVIFSQIPFIGKGFAGIILIIAAIFWIILMIKAYAGEAYKVLWAGNLAEKLQNETEKMSETGSPYATRPPAPQPPNQNPPPPPPPPPSAQAAQQAASQSSSKTFSQTRDDWAREASLCQQERAARQSRFRTRYYSFRSRAARITGSAFAIAWSIVFIIFFNFFNNYIAYYSVDHTSGGDLWTIHTLITPDFNNWLPIITVTLILVIVGHTLMIIFDRYWLRNIIEIVLDTFGLICIISLLSIFPFDFSVLPSDTAAYWAWLGLKIILILIAVGSVVGIIVKFIRFVIDLAEGRY